jgi:hypothetical protein
MKKLVFLIIVLLLIPNTTFAKKRKKLKRSIEITETLPLQDFEWYPIGEIFDFNGDGIWSPAGSGTAAIIDTDSAGTGSQCLEFGIYEDTPGAMDNQPVVFCLKKGKNRTFRASFNMKFHWDNPQPEDQSWIVPAAIISSKDYDKMWFAWWFMRIDGSVYIDPDTTIAQLAADTWHEINITANKKEDKVTIQVNDEDPVEKALSFWGKENNDMQCLMLFVGVMNQPLAWVRIDNMLVQGK